MVQREMAVLRMLFKASRNCRLVNCAFSRIVFHAESGDHIECIGIREDVDIPIRNTVHLERGTDLSHKIVKRRTEFHRESCKERIKVDRAAQSRNVRLEVLVLRIKSGLKLNFSDCWLSHPLTFG
jgi:hypothetical protein